MHRVSEHYETLAESPVDGPSSRKIFVFAWLFLLLANATCMLNPPYWDAIVGLFHQAVWLHRNSFDYRALFGQASYYEGGPNVVLLYLLAPVYACLYAMLPAKLVFLVAHLLALGCAAATIALLYAVAKRHIPWRHAVAWCVVGAAEPIWSGQTAAMYMEIPLAAAFAAVILAADRRNWSGAALFCLLAYLIKPSALIMAAALFCWVVLVTTAGWLASIRGKRRAFDVRVLFLAVPLPIALCLDRIQNVPFEGMIFDLDRSRWMLATLFPSVAAYWIVILAAVFCLTLSRNKLRAWIEELMDYSVSGILLILIAGFWLSFFLYPYPLCRYSCALLVPMSVLAGLLGNRAFGRASLVIALFFFLYAAANQYGTFLPEPPPEFARSGHVLERSREFLLDLRSNRRLCQEIEQNHADNPVVAKYPHVQMLTMPEMGYVQNGLTNVYTTGRLPVGTGAQMLTPEIAGRPDTIYVYAPNSFELQWLPSLRPPRSAEILFLDTSLGSPLILYRR